jgi:outer membrane lipoprotein SlyB
MNAGGDVDSFYVVRDLVRLIALGNTAVSYSDVITGAHTYGIIAKSNECGISDTSTFVAGQGHAPAGAVTGLAVGTANSDSIRLTWTAAPGEVTGYYIYRDAARVDTVDLVTSWSDHGVYNMQNHQYAVAAFNTVCGEGTQGGPVAGHLTPMADMTSTVPDTVWTDLYMRFTYTFHGAPMDSVRYFMSRDGGANYAYLQTTRPPVQSDSVQLLNPPSNTCRIKVYFHRNNGARTDSMVTRLFVLMANAVEDPSLTIPKDFFLDQNYPNPFNPSTVIRFGVPKESRIVISVYDVLGREVATVVDNVMRPGIHMINWDCSGCPSGMYLIRMQTGDRTMLRKMLLMK